MNFGSPENIQPKNERDIKLEQIEALEARVESLLHFADIKSPDEQIIEECKSKIRRLKEELDEDEL